MNPTRKMIHHVWGGGIQQPTDPSLLEELRMVTATDYHKVPTPSTDNTFTVEALRGGFLIIDNNTRNKIIASKAEEIGKIIAAATVASKLQGEPSE